VQELLRERNTTNAKLRDLEATAKVDQAVKEGYITPAMRVWALQLCAAAPAKFEEVILKGKPAFGHVLELTSFGDLPGTVTETAAHKSDEEKMSAMLGIPVDRLK